MDIRGLNNNRKLGANLYETTNKDYANKAGNYKSVPNSAADKIEISQEAKNLSVIDFAKARIKADAAKDVSGEKIHRLKEQIKNGAYKIDANALANAIITGTHE